MMDEKGRLFGKINIVDLLIIVIIIAAIAFVGIKYVLPAQSGENAVKPVTMVFHADTSKNFVVDNLKAGAVVNDNGTKTNLGEVLSWSSEPYYEHVVDKTGLVTEYKTEDTSVVDIVVQGTGIQGEHGVTINNTLYGIGHTMVIYCGDCKFYVSVKEIKF